MSLCKLFDVKKNANCEYLWKKSVTWRTTTFRRFITEEKYTCGVGPQAYLYPLMVLQVKNAYPIWSKGHTFPFLRYFWQCDQVVQAGGACRVVKAVKYVNYVYTKFKDISNIGVSPYTRFPVSHFHTSGLPISWLPFWKCIVL